MTQDAPKKYPPKLTLVIGNKNYSSWSLRPWLAMKVCDIDFAEVLIPLRHDNTKQQILKYSPAGHVPVLKLGDFVVWDSLAIIEYLADHHPEANLWPSDPSDRAIARAIAAEAHSGFGGMRSTYPMNLRRSASRAVPLDVIPELKRLDYIMGEMRVSLGREGGFLYGQFGAIDAMLAPYATRMASYKLPVSAHTREYVAAIYALPAFKQWQQAALQEPWKIVETDDIDYRAPVRR